MHTQGLRPVTSLAATAAVRQVGTAATKATYAMGLVLAFLFAGFVLMYSSFLAMFLAVLFVLAVIAVRFGALGLTIVLVAALPWLEVFQDLVPAVVGTFVAAGAVIAFSRVAARRAVALRANVLVGFGIVFFFTPVLISLATSGGYDQAIEASKYVLFPAMILVVNRAGDSDALRTVARVTLLSAGAALVIHLGLGFAGVGKIGTKYGSGEILGFGDAHHIALLASCLVAGALDSELRLQLRLVVVGAGAVATLATGVRSALVGLAVLALGTVIWSKSRRTALALLLAALGFVLWSGVEKVAEHRYAQSAQSREFSQFQTVGSNRGEIWTVAVDHWKAAGPLAWTFGTGLRSIPKFENQQIGQALVGHSDIVQVGVELGIVGLLGLVLLWIALIRGAVSKLPLFTLGAFAALNGALEYSGPIVVALVLMAAAPKTGGVMARVAAAAIRLPRPLRA